MVKIRTEEGYMKKFAMIAIIVFGLGLMVPFGASALPNYLANGSFEDGLTGWTQTDTSPIDGNPVYPVAVILTDGVTGSAFSEISSTGRCSQHQSRSGRHSWGKSYSLMILPIKGSARLLICLLGSSK